MYNTMNFSLVINSLTGGISQSLRLELWPCNCYSRKKPPSYRCRLLTRMRAAGQA